MMKPATVLSVFALLFQHDAFVLGREEKDVPGGANLGHFPVKKNAAADFAAAASIAVKNDDEYASNQRLHSSIHRSNGEQDRITIVNMTCDFFEQPLNHFFNPKEKSPSYKQRYCVYNRFVKNMSTAPIFFYTGNESPLEQYINNTGLMWELAPEFDAQVIFMEHRYEGKSLPSPSIEYCLSYSSSKQAIEDYARFLEFWLLNTTASTKTTSSVDVDIDLDGTKHHHHESDDETPDMIPGILPRRPVIVFGGSYGGMLSAWFRMKYPQLVSGAIAASAPIWALPRTNPNFIDGSHQIVKRGIQLPYPPTRKTFYKTSNAKNPVKDDARPENHCATNLLASWPLMKFLAEQQANTETLDASRSSLVGARLQTTVEKPMTDPPPPAPPGLAKLTEWFRLCQPLQHVEELMDWVRAPWFDMAEGSFPYASSYIPFALIPSNGTILKLPPWPLQAACWNQSILYQDWGVRMDGDRSNVQYNVTYGNSSLALAIDWDTMKPVGSVNLDTVLASSQVQGLLTSVRDAVAVWYNITKHEPCFNLTPANNLKATMRTSLSSRRRQRSRKDDNHRANSGTSTTSQSSALSQQKESPAVPKTVAALRKLKDTKENATALCEERIKEGSWNALCCNEEMNTMVMEARGMGHDMFWPPNYPRGTVSHADVIRHDAQTSNETVPGYCLDPKGIFGYSQQPYDPWSTRLDTYYGGLRIESFSNIVFSNGLLDPWVAGGVNVPSMAELHPTDDPSAIPSYNGPMVRPIGPESQNMIALIIEYGGHHTDLMYSSKEDPECVTKAREIEKSYIAKWIKAT